MKLPPGYVAGEGVRKATAYGGLGQRLLERMGWSKGQGLGREKDGMKEAIEVKKKEDTLGVGANAASWNWEQKYWEDAYNSAIRNINHETSGSSSSGGGSSVSTDAAEDSSTSSSSSDSDLGGNRHHCKRVRRRATAAAAATAADAAAGAIDASRMPPTVNRDGTLATASAAELRIAAELAKDPWGRWGGRAGKMARIRAQEQEEANRAREKLGLPQLPIAAPPTAAEESDSSSSSSSSSSDEDNEDGPSTSGRKAIAGAAGAGGKGAHRKMQKREKTKKKTKKKMTVETEKKDEETETDQNGVAKGKKARKEERSKQGNACLLGSSGAAGDDGASPPQDSAAVAVVAPKQPAAKRLMVVVVGNEASIAARLKMFATFKRTPATGWWGDKMFVSAGLLESLEDEAAGDQRLSEAAQRLEADLAAGRAALAGTAAVAAGQRRGFNEDDQTALYKRAHDLQRTGRRGLGKAEVRVGGTKWEGTKKTFDDELEDGGQSGSRGEEDREGDAEKKAWFRSGGGESTPLQETAAVDADSEEADEDQEEKKKKDQRRGKKGKKQRPQQDAVVDEEGAAVDKMAKKKARKEQRQQQREPGHEGELQVDTAEAAAMVEGTSRKAKRRRGDDGGAAAVAVAVHDEANNRQDPQLQQRLEVAPLAKSQKDRIAFSCEGEGPDSSAPTRASEMGDGPSKSNAGGAPSAAASKPKWLKLARMVLKKSSERRMKLRKVIAELLQHAEAHHHHHHHHRHEPHKHHPHKQKPWVEGDGESKKADRRANKAGTTTTGATPNVEHAGPWDHESVRQALERKIRKSNSGLVIDGKFLTLLEAS